ncbi:MAG: hypothetical protein WC919_08280 [Candidatus Paceibacterota bacterium]|jgi:hypothetical protein
MKEALCRPDESRWCVECCPPKCPLLGYVEDGKKGCLGHGGKKFDGLTERPICLDLDCLEGFSQKDRETVKQIILEMPSGQFEMSQALILYRERKYNDEKE